MIGNVSLQCFPEGKQLWTGQEDITNDDTIAFQEALETNASETDKIRDELLKCCRANYKGRLEAVCKYLKSADVPLEDKSMRGVRSETALHAALFCGSQEAVDVLLQYGGLALARATIDDPQGDYSGANALHICVSTGNRTALGKILSLEEDDKARGVLLEQEATGKLFRGDKLPSAGTPLCMAACGGDLGMVEDLIEAGAQLDRKHSESGDTLFHVLCQYSAVDFSRAKEMYDAILTSEKTRQWWSNKRGSKQLPGAEEGLMKRYLLRLQNKNMETPLQMAARLQTIDFIDVIMKTDDVYRFTQWECGQNKKVLYDVTEVEPMFAGRGVPSILELLLYTSDNVSWCRQAVFKALLDKKWNMFRVHFTVWALLHITLMVVFTGYHTESFDRCKEGPPMMMPPPGAIPPGALSPDGSLSPGMTLPPEMIMMPRSTVPPQHPVRETPGPAEQPSRPSSNQGEEKQAGGEKPAGRPRGQPPTPPCTQKHLHLAAEVFIILMAVLYSLSEGYDAFYTAIYRGLMGRICRRGCPPCVKSIGVPFSVIFQKDLYWNLISIVFFSIIIPRPPPSLPSNPKVFAICNMLTAIFGWLLVLSFTRPFRKLGFFTTMLQRVLFGPLWYFFLVYLIISLAFSTAIHSIFFNFPTPSDFGTLIDTMTLLFRNMFGLDEPPSSPFPPLVSTINALVCLFVLAGSALLVSLLIASIVQAYAEASAESTEIWLQNRAKAVMLVERRIIHYFRPALSVTSLPVPVVNPDDVTHVMPMDETPERKLFAVDEN